MISIALAFSFHQTVLKDIHIPVAPIEKVLVQLSEIYHSPMDVSNALTNKHILIEATQVSEKDVRDQIAKLINASWERKGAVWHLTKSSKQEREDLERGVAMRYKMLKQTADLRDQSLSEKPVYTSEVAKQTYFQMKNEAEKKDPNQMVRPGPTAAGYQLPNQRFFSRFLKEFGLKRIAEIPFGHRAVYAIHPNAMQQPMGFDIEPEIQQYRKEYLTWFQTAEPLVRNPETTVRLPNRSGGAGVELGGDDIGDDLNNAFGTFPTELKDFIFTVYCSTDGAYQMQLIGVPQVDDNIAYKIGGTSYEGAFAGMEAQDFEIKPDPNFKLSQDSADFKQFFESHSEQIPATRRDAVLKMIADPVSRDPLAFGYSEGISYDFKRIHMNVIALGRDGGLNQFEPMYAEMIQNPKFTPLLEDFMVKDGSWVRLLEPPNDEPVFPRRDLKRLITTVQANGRVNIAERAAIAAIRPRNNAVSYVERLLEKFGQTAEEEYCDPDALKIIGLLSESERIRAFSPTGIPYGQLNPRLKAHLFECCFFNDRPRIIPSNQDSRNVSRINRAEPTYQAPNGILPDSIFKITETSEVQVKEADGINAEGIQAIGLMSNAKGWGAVKYQLDHPDEYKGRYFYNGKESQRSEPKALYITKLSRYEMRLHITKDCEWGANLQNVDRVGRDTFTINSFPEEFKADLEAGYKQAAEAMKRQQDLKKKRDGGGGTTRQIVR